MLEKRIGIIMYQTSTTKGQELVAQRMVRYLIKLGQKAYLITSNYHDGTEVIPWQNLREGKGYLYVEDKVLRIPVIRVDSYAATWPPRRIMFRDFMSTLERIVDEFGLNVLITHSTLWNGPEEVAKFVAWRRHMRDLGGYQDPIVFCHMSHFQEPSPSRYSLHELTFRTAWNKFSLPRIFETANLILVVSPLAKKAMVKMGAKPERCFLLPGGVDDEVAASFATADTTQFLQRYNISSNSHIMSYLGSIEERKNPLAVLKVAEILKERPEVHFVIAGKGDSSYAMKVEEIARGLPNVSYLGEIDDKDKVLLMKVSYLNILLSHLEALGIAQLEFMYHGVPVITSAVGGQSWVVGDGEEGVHVKGPDDIKGAANAIIELVRDRQRWKQMSVKAKGKASKFASSKIMAELDATINGEMIKESGLMPIPAEVSSTLREPEQALKSWSRGSWGLVATNKRLFLRQGIIFRKVTELPYASIRSIEHLRRYPWGSLIVGAAFSVFFLIAPSLKPLFSQPFLTWIENLVSSLLLMLPSQYGVREIVKDFFPLLPFLVSIIVFCFQSKSGFNLHGAGIKPLYLPGQFRKAIQFIRTFHDKELGTAGKGEGGEETLPST
jgi:glycosyltransferase involved in cell wall biosynthesis